MTRRRIERACWVVTLVAVAAALVLSYRPVGGVAPQPLSASPLAVLSAPVDADALEDAVTTIGAGNLFRMSRAAAEPGIAPQLAGPAPAPPPSMKPRLALRGIVGGPPWDALIDGVPGHDGAIVIRDGQTIAGITVRAVRRDTVVVRGFDTTWALTLGRSW